MLGRPGLGWSYFLLTRSVLVTGGLINTNEIFAEHVDSESLVCIMFHCGVRRLGPVLKSYSPSLEERWLQFIRGHKADVKDDRMRI